MTPEHSNKTDKNGKAIDFLKWAILFEDREYRQVALTKLKKGTVSTVWIGIKGEEFETAWLPNKGDINILRRYKTLKEALDGHNEEIERYS